MKFSAVFSAALAYASFCAAAEGAEDLQERDGNTCSIGIGRVSGSINWDATIYNVPGAQRQDVNIVGTATFVPMDKGQTMTVTGPPTVTVTNVDNAPVFTYDVPLLQVPLDEPGSGTTKVDLKFESGNSTWGIDDCWPGNVIFSAGRESWSCDFAC